MSKPTENVYRPCPCGSGEKYKFCCLDKDRGRRRDLARLSGLRLPLGGEDGLLPQLDAAEEAHRRGGALVEQLRGREAIPHLERAIKLCPLVPFPYNNLAMAHFLEGDVEKALEICDHVDRVVDPGNVFALGQRVHYLLLLGRRTEAEETGRRILGLPGRDEFAVYKKCEALGRLRRHSEVYTTASRALLLDGECRKSFAFYAGTASANLARYDDAERLLEEALEDRAHGRQAQAHLTRLRRRQGPGTLLGEWSYLEWGHWTPPGMLERLKSEEEARRYPGFVETIACLVNENLEDPAPLHLLGLLRTPEAIELLRRIAFGTFGPERLRFGALGILLDKGVVSADGPVDVWVAGQWRSIRPMRQELTFEASPPLAEAVRPKMGEMLVAMRARQWRKAEALGREILSQAPEFPQALYNLAMAVRSQERKDEAEALLRRAIAADPSYLFAPASLASMKLADGKVDEARKILDEVKLTEKLNPDGYVMFLLAQADVAVMEGRPEDASRSWRMAEEIAPDHPAVEESRESLAWCLADGVTELLERSNGRRERQQRRLLSRQATLEESLRGYRVVQLQDMGRALGLERVSGLRKEELTARLIAALRNPDAVRAHIRALPADAKEALRQVWAAGDSMAHDQFTKAFGPVSTKAAPQPPPYHETPLGRLGELGLLAVGTVGDRTTVLIPMELRGAVAAEFQSPQSAQGCPAPSTERSP
jgi:tetratricopeptide (TPR) repeat protein